MAVEPAYTAALTDVSARTLRAQGGPMTDDEVAAVERRSGWSDAVRLRRWDDAAKDPEATVPGIDAYVPLLEAQSRSLHTRR